MNTNWYIICAVFFIYCFTIMVTKIHSSAEVHQTATIWTWTSVRNRVQIRENVVIGKNCIISKGVYIDYWINIGDNVKIQNHVSIYHGVTIESWVFVWPHVCFTNDKFPRAINQDWTIKSNEDWIISPIVVKYGASIWANATICPWVTIGKFAMIGAGSVVTKDVPDYALVYGNPAKIHGKVNESEIVEKF